MRAVMNGEKVQKIDVKAFLRLEKEFLIVKRLEKGNFNKLHDVLYKHSKTVSRNDDKKDPFMRILE